MFFIEPWFDHKIALSPDHSQPFIYLNGAILLLKTPIQQIVEIKCSLKPGPLKCFCAPCHQISTKSAAQKARNRDKAKFVAKLRKLSKDYVNVNNEEDKGLKLAF